MSRLLFDFLKANKGRNIFIGVTPTPNGNKAGTEGILEDYDETHVLIRGTGCVMLTAISHIISFEIAYKDLNMIEVVVPCPE